MASSKVTVISGQDRLSTENLVGKSIDDVRTELGTPLHIGSNTTATVNGETQDDNYKLRAGDELRFTRPSGTKGN